MSEIEKPLEQIVEVDGSFGEGGGQIIRNAVTLSCLLKKQAHVSNIRANRPNPGLASQHLESIKAMLRISGATTPHPPKKKDTSFELNATGTKSGAGVNTTIDLVTAGSCTLCLQCILPFLLSLKSTSRVKIIGGTHVMKSPSFDYFERVFLPTLNSAMGKSVCQTWLRAPGYFPRGGGCVEIEVNGSKFHPIVLTERGAVTKIEAILNVPSTMEKHIQQKMKDLIYTDTRNLEVRHVNFASVEYFLHCEHSRAGFSHLVEGRNPQPEQLIKAIELVQKEVKSFLQTPAALDAFMQDQLIIYMTLAKLEDPSSHSRIKTIKLEDHAKSAIHVSQLFCPNNIYQVVENGDETFDIVL